MLNVELLMVSLEYIENHLGDDIKTADVAAACFCSKSTLEKIFRCVYQVSVHDYLVYRRMMGAAKRLAMSEEESILDIAVDYGYTAHASFARAFERVWNCKPSEFRKRKYTELFPRFRPVGKEGEYSMEKRVDIHELYDLYQERKDCYFVCCDIKGLTDINNVSRLAGNKCILEAMNRIVEIAGKTDMVFRIGGDEFCILTDHTEETYARRLVEKIMDKNGETFSFEDRQIPLELHATALCLKQEEKMVDDRLLSSLHGAIEESKNMACGS